MVTIALLRSYSPPSIFRVSASTTSCCSSSRPRVRSAVTSSPPLPLHHFLRFRLIAPEAGRGNALRQLRQFLVEPCTLKDASAVHPHAGGDRRTVWSDHQNRQPV